MYHPIASTSPRLAVLLSRRHTILLVWFLLQSGRLWSPLRNAQQPCSVLGYLASIADAAKANAAKAKPGPAVNRSGSQPLTSLRLASQQHLAHFAQAPQESG